MITHIKATELKVGDKVIDANGDVVTVTKIASGDQSDFGKIGKFWTTACRTVWFRDKERQTLHCVLADSDKVELVANKLDA